MFHSNEKVLIVDSMISMRKLMVKICHEIGITEIVEADSGSSAWTMISANGENIQLVICDWQMQDGNGLDLLKRIRSAARFAKLPFIMTSTLADPLQISQAMKAGVSSFLIKPFNGESLREKITAIQKK